VQNTVGEAPLTAEQEERNMQEALAQTTKDAAARKVARATLKRRARLHNLKIKVTGADGHCLQYSVQDQFAQQGIDGQTMQVLRAAMAALIGGKAEYFQQFLIAEDRKRKSWKRFLSDIRHSVGNAKRWGGDLEISALSCMFQCPIQCITSRQGHEFDGLVTMKPNASLHGRWRKFKRQNHLAVDFNLKPLNLIYEEERHSEPLTPQVGTSAAGRTALATIGSSEGVLDAEEPAVGAPSSKVRGTSTSSSAPISALSSPLNGSGRLFRSNSRSNTADPGPLSQASGSNLPVSLLPRPRIDDNIFLGLSSGSDDECCTWLSKNKLAPLLGASSYRLFDAGYFQGTFINPTLYSALGARWRPDAPTSNQCVHTGLSAAIRSQAFDFSPTQQADLNLPVLSLSSRIECDGIFYSPLSADTRKTLPYCVLYSDGDVEWRSASEARSEHRARSNWLASFQSHPMIRLLACSCGTKRSTNLSNSFIQTNTFWMEQPKLS